ncbi:uncharacterized protein [Dermacentor andersoni]|uniref:uncharacterized protein isoform X3 n=1 Tax=Dermacentor andersoni TaxID=34620 RepID=UPI003B3BC191
MQGKLPRARSVKCASSEFSAFVRLTKDEGPSLQSPITAAWPRLTQSSWISRPTPRLCTAFPRGKGTSLAVHGHLSCSAISGGLPANWESLELKAQPQAQQHNTIAAQPTWQVAADMPSGGQKSSRTTLWNSSCSQQKL